MPALKNLLTPPHPERSKPVGVSLYPDDLVRLKELQAYTGGNPSSVTRAAIKLLHDKMIEERGEE